MSAPGAQRYTDLDIRVDPSLIGHAINYARQYVGEWDVMLAARDLALGTGNLPLPIARLVLNCARVDPRWCTTLPTPQSKGFVGAFPSTGSAQDPDEDDEDPEDFAEPPRPTGRPRRLAVVREPTRRPFDLKVTWKRRYGYSPGIGKRPMGNLALPMCRTCQRILEDPESPLYDKARAEWWLAEQERLTAPRSEHA
jgi:hypothetical protein